MAVLALFRYRGDPIALAAAYQQLSSAHGDPPERELEVVARADDGLLVVEVWQFRVPLENRIAGPRFATVLGEAGLPEPAIEVLEADSTRFSLIKPFGYDVPAP